MKVWRLVFTAADGRGGGETYQDRWLAEERFEAAKKDWGIVILAEFINNRQTEIVRDSRFEVERKQP